MPVTGAAKGPAGPNPNDDWALNDEAIKNLGYMQMKKTHDAAMVLMERMYGGSPSTTIILVPRKAGARRSPWRSVIRRTMTVSRRTCRS